MFKSDNFETPQAIYAYDNVMYPLNMSWDDDGENVQFFVGEQEIWAYCTKSSETYNGASSNLFFLSGTAIPLSGMEACDKDGWKISW